MALQQLGAQEIRDWTRAQKDEWWLRTVYRGDMAQLTLRAAVTGALLGAVLAGTALYVGAKTGITIGVGVTSVILSFAIYRIASRAGLGRDFTVLENNCTQSIATAAGYMISPLIGALAAYMLITGRIPPWWHLFLWMVTVALIGVLVAFPLKRRFINEEQMPFPEGRASGVVLDSLYSGGEREGLQQARLLAFTALGAATWQVLVSEGWMKLLQFRLLRLGDWAGLQEPWTIHERLDTYYYDLATRLDLAIPRILGVDFRQLGLRFTLDAAMVGIGGLMGIRVASSCLLGSLINYTILAPAMIRLGDIAPRTLPDGTIVALSRNEIVNQWSLWWGIAMMVAGSIASLLARPGAVSGALAMLRPRARGTNGSDVLRHIELPLALSFAGIPVLAVAGAAITHEFFGVPWLLSIVSLPLIFVLAVICANSMGLTSWVPLSAVSKITQFTVGAVDRANPASNLIPAGMTGEICANASNLLSDIKPGYMLGAKPRQQAIGHAIGVFAGAAAAIPLFFVLFLPAGADGVRTTASMVSDQFAFPAAMQWKGVAELVAHGVRGLPLTALVSVAVAAAAAIGFEIARRLRGSFPLEPVSMGLGVVLPPEATLAMWLGAALFWIMGRRHRDPESPGHATWVRGMEPICAGLISGSALVGIGNALLVAFVL